MTTYGLTATGYTAKTYEVLLSEVEARQRERISAALALTSSTFLGNLNAIFADKARELWELGQAVTDALDPDAATGPLLTSLSKLTGTIQRGLRYGTVTESVTFSQAQTIAALSLTVAHSSDPANLWMNISEIVATSAGTVEVPMRSVLPGSAAQAQVGTLTVVASGGTSVTAVTNATTAAPGYDVESPDELRSRRETGLAASGLGTTAAIRAAVEAVAGVVTCRVIENDTDVEVDGIPAKRMLALVWDGVGEDAADGSIAQAIYESRAGGCRTYGTEAVSIADSWGVLKPYYFSRMTGVEISVEVYYYGESSASIIQDAILEYQPDQGEDLIWGKVHSLIMGAEGVTDIYSLTLQRGSDTPVSANISMALDEYALFNASRITVSQVL